MSTYFVNCVNDAAADECVRNALRVIEANRFRYKKFKFAPTNNITRTVRESLDYFFCDDLRQFGFKILNLQTKNHE